MSARFLVVAAAASFAVLPACSQQDAGDSPRAATSDASLGTVAATIAGLADHRQLATALTDTQLAPVFDGKVDYTLLAPSDAAFDALGDKGDALSRKDQRPLMIAVLRGHVLPGQVTPQAIEKAIDRKDGPVEMRTMAGGTVRFAKTDEGLTVSNGSETATIASAAKTASNGAVLPIDKVLLPAQ